MRRVQVTRIRQTNSRIAASELRILCQTSAMDNAVCLPSEVAAEAGDLLRALGQAGWTIYGGRYDADTMGNWYVDLRRSDQRMRLVKDRSQYMVTNVPGEVLKAAGLWKAFDDWQEFRAAVLGWAEHSEQPYHSGPRC